MDKINLKHSFVQIKDRNTATLDGIINIERFDDRGVNLKTEKGKIEIEGEGLKIVSLSKDDGVINIEGKINGIFYEGDKQMSKSFWGRLFG